MKIIIDTHIFLWILNDPEKVETKKLIEIQTKANQIYLSSISVAELMIKSSLNKILIQFDPIEMAIKTGIEILDFSASDALLLKNLPYHHKDPFDRMIIAQSINRGYYLMSDDEKFKNYECRLI